MKKKLLLVLLLIVSAFCFSEKWEKEVTHDSWGEVNGTRWTTSATITNTSRNGCISVDVIYMKPNDARLGFSFTATFEYIAPYVYSGYVEVKDGPKKQVYVLRQQNFIGFLLIGLTLEEYRRFYEGKLVQLQWDNGEYITIKAPVWE